MKRLLAFLLVIVFTFSLVACGEKKSDEPVINNEVSEVENDDADVEETDEETDDNESEDEGVYSNKVYYVGDDIPAGGYVVNCTNTEYGMEVVVFESEKEYQDFQNAERFTNGEYRAAIEANAWADFYLEQDESAFIGLRSGNVILLDDGKCEFSKHDALSSNTLYSGIYVVGTDINAETLDIKCTTDYLHVTVFENEGKYLDYHKSDRFTVGEESDAIEKNSASTDFIYKDNTTSVNLKDGMILMVEDGIGEYSVDEGPVIN